MAEKILKIGLLHGDEGDGDFPRALIEEINSRKLPNIIAEDIKVPDLIIGEPCEYAVIIDRASHGIKYYREYTKNALLSGTYVINNPFRFSWDKFFDYSVALKLGIKVPRTLILPPKEYKDGITVNDLTNLTFPLNWDHITNYIGFPAILKKAVGPSYYVYDINNIDELMEVYENSGSNIMLMQQKINFVHYVRAFCYGKKYVIPLRYIPSTREYICDHKHLSDELGSYIVQKTLIINKVLDYDMNTVEWAIDENGIPYAIDFTNLVPDFSPDSITYFYFKEAVRMMADVAIEYAINPPRVRIWDTIDHVFTKKDK